MAEWWQSPAYNARAAAGQVVTPGLVDWGGLLNAFNAPYNERVGRLPVGPSPASPASVMQFDGARYEAYPSRAGDVNAYYNAGPSGPAAAKQSRLRGGDPLQEYAESGYVAKPRFVANMPPALPAAQPSGSVRVAKDRSRLSQNAFGYGANGVTGLQPNQAVAAINAAAPKGPMFPLHMPGKGTPFGSGYTASMRFASPNAGKTGDGVIDLTASNPSDRGAQGIADSQGAPVRVGQKVYYPGGKAPVGAPQARNAPATQQRSGGLLGSLFGGGNLGGGNPVSITVPGGGQQAPRNAAGRPTVAAPGPVINGATYGTTTSGSVGDYGSSRGQITAGLKPGDRKYDADTNSWGLR